MTCRYFSTFSGIGGFELGIQQAYEKNSRVEREGRQIDTLPIRQKEEYGSGVGDTQAKWNSNGFDQSTPSCVGYSEIDKYAIKIYEQHFPTHKNYGDITKIDWSRVPDFDLLVGGFPCQSFSIAGKRGGFEDTRGTLFFELAKALSIKRPANFIFENVKGLLNHDQGKTFTVIIQTLAELDYNAQVVVLNSKNYGVPQNRERVFIIGTRGDCPRKVLHFGSTDEVHFGPNEVEEKVHASTLTARQFASWNGNYVKQLVGGSQGQRVYDPSGVAVTQSAQGGGQGAKTGLYMVAGNENGKRVLSAKPTDIAGTLTATMFKGINASGRTGVMSNYRIRRLTPVECERLQGFPDGWTNFVSDSQRYKCLGNAVTVNVVSEIIKQMFL